jgi:hypothetical protein
MNEGVCGGHFSPKVIAHHIIIAIYYWPTIFKDSYSFIKKFPAYHKFYGGMKREVMPLQPILVDVHFI